MGWVAYKQNLFLTIQNVWETRGQVSHTVVGPGQLSGIVFKRVLIPVLRAPPQKPDHLVRSPTPDTITLENRTQRMHLEGAWTPTLHVTVSFLLFIWKTLIRNILGEKRIYQNSRLQWMMERKPQQWKLEISGHTMSTAQSREKWRNSCCLFACLLACLLACWLA